VKCAVFNRSREFLFLAKIRVIVADDYAAVRSRVRQALGDEFELVATAENGEEAVSAVLRLDPDVLVIDISMPVLNGLEAACSLRDTHCKAKIIFLTIHEDVDFVQAAFAAGARGYVTKARLSTDLVRAIHEAVQGRTYLSASLQPKNG
jgi:DNA-binding NarL/FixJ family response regulator